MLGADSAGRGPFLDLIDENILKFIVFFSSDIECDSREVADGASFLDELHGVFSAQLTERFAASGVTGGDDVGIEVKTDDRHQGGENHGLAHDLEHADSAAFHGGDFTVGGQFAEGQQGGRHDADRDG